MWTVQPHEKWQNKLRYSLLGLLPPLLFGSLTWGFIWFIHMLAGREGPDFLQAMGLVFFGWRFVNIWKGRQNPWDF